VSRADDLAAKRRALQLRCAVEREEIRYRHADVEAQLRTADRVIDVARGVVRHPLLIGAAVVGVAMIGPFNIVRWISQSMFLWTAVRRIGGYFFSRDQSTSQSPQ
jgi:hypothetical protein